MSHLKNVDKVHLFVKYILFFIDESGAYYFFSCTIFFFSKNHLYALGIKNKLKKRGNKNPVFFFPQLLTQVRYRDSRNVVVKKANRKKGRKIKENKRNFIAPAFFRVFTDPLPRSKLRKKKLKKKIHEQSKNSYVKKNAKNAKILYRHFCQKSLLYYLLDRIIAWIFVVCTPPAPWGRKTCSVCSLIPLPLAPFRLQILRNPKQKKNIKGEKINKSGYDS